MEKSKIFIVATLLIVLVVGMSACNTSSEDTALTKEGSESDHRSESTIDMSTDSTVIPHNNELNSRKSEDKKVEEPSQNSNKPDLHTSTNDQTKQDNISKNADSSQSNGSSTDSSTISDNSEAKQAIVISSGEKAIQHLKQQLPEGKDDDVSFGVDETLASDDYGSYYTIQLVSISTRVSGKTGNLGYYKVYEDGTYKPF